MRRRDITGGIAVASMMGPRFAWAQPAGKVRRIGLLSNDPHSSRSAQGYWGVFREDLQRFGWTEGKTVSFELASPDGHFDRLPAVARELVDRKVELIVVSGGLASLAVRDATRTIPVVFIGAGDPLGAGLVSSMARPGGNITGLSEMSNELIAKRLQILIEVASAVSRVAYLTYETGTTGVDDETTRAAVALGLRWEVVKVKRQEDLAVMVAGYSNADAWYVGDPIRVFPRDQVVSLLGAHRKPAVYPNSPFVRAGGLLSYAANPFALARRAAWYVDQILRGARPGDMPVEQPTTFELLVNLAAARAQGIDIPPSVLLRADEVIE